MKNLQKPKENQCFQVSGQPGHLSHNIPAAATAKTFQIQHASHHIPAQHSSQDIPATTFQPPHFSAWTPQLPHSSRSCSQDIPDTTFQPPHPSTTVQPRHSSHNTPATTPQLPHSSHSSSQEIPASTLQPPHSSHNTPAANAPANTPATTPQPPYSSHKGQPQHSIHSSTATTLSS